VDELHAAAQEAVGDAERVQKYEWVLDYLLRQNSTCPFCGRSESLLLELRDGEGWGNFGGWIRCSSCRREWTDPNYWGTFPGMESGAGITVLPAREPRGLSRERSDPGSLNG
jgi:hypothetical protein